MNKGEELAALPLLKAALAEAGVSADSETYLLDEASDGTGLLEVAILLSDRKRIADLVSSGWTRGFEPSRPQVRQSDPIEYPTHALMRRRIRVPPAE